MVRDALASALDLMTFEARQASNVTTSSSNATSSAAMPEPTGNLTMTLDCTVAEPGDTCDSVAGELGISTSAFLAANPSIDAACDNLLAGVKYCV